MRKQIQKGGRLMVGILLILMAWFIDMPLWLSITMTICGAIRFLGKITLYGIKVGQEIKKD